MRIAEMQERYPEEGFSVEQRVRSVGGLGFYMPLLSSVLSGMFFALGYIFYISKPERQGPGEDPSNSTRGV